MHENDGNVYVFGQSDLMQSQSQWLCAVCNVHEPKSEWNRREIKRKSKFKLNEWRIGLNNGQMVQRHLCVSPVG